MPRACRPAGRARVLRDLSAAALSDTSQEVAASIGMAVAGTIVAAAATASGSLANVGASTTGIHAFENAVTVATLVLTGARAALVGWAGWRPTRSS